MYSINTYERGNWGNVVSSSRMHWALANDGLGEDDTRHIFLGNNIFIFWKGMRDGIGSSIVF